MADITRGSERCKSAKEFSKGRFERSDKTDVTDLTLIADENNNKTKTNSSVFTLDLSKPEFIVTESSSDSTSVSYSLTKIKSFKKQTRPSTTVSHPTNSATFVKPSRSKSSMKILNRSYSVDQKDSTFKNPKSSLTLDEISCTLKPLQIDSSFSSTTLTDLPILKKLCSNAKFYHEKNVLICGKNYKIGKEIGRGGSSRVYEAKYKNSTFAIKIVDFDDVSDTVINGYMEEVKLLEQFQDEEEIIQMEAYELKENEGEKQLFVVMEKGENDFLTFLRSSDRSPNLIRYYWESMLKCVKLVHRKNIVHSDLKPANFIFVKNKLKLIDFGIASAIPTDLTSIPKEGQAGTLNYMSPESIQCRRDDDKVHIPLASDIWSLGCILYSMVYGSPPFGHITSQMAKINAILYKDIEFKPIDDEQLLNVMQECLQRDYQKRPTVTHLLEHTYLRPNTSTVTNTVISNFTSSKKNEFGDEDSVMVGKIFDEVCNNTPRTAAKKVYKMLKAHSIGAN